MRTLLVISCALVIVACKKDPAPSVAPPEAKAEVKAEVKQDPPKPAEEKVAAPAANRVELKVTEAGFEPSNVTLKKDQAVTFVVTRVSDATCATELLIAGTDIKADLPLNKPVEIAWTPTKAGQVKFGCAMDMMVSGLLLVE